MQCYSLLDWFPLFAMPQPMFLTDSSLFVSMPQPKFLTKAERAALALQRRQEETAGLRAQQEELRHGLQRQQVQQVSVVQRDEGYMMCQGDTSDRTGRARKLTTRLVGCVHVSLAG
jgi:hypothetical protein